MVHYADYVRQERQVPETDFEHLKGEALLVHWGSVQGHEAQTQYFG